ncbi:unnamed protein product [Symbiodinium sp. CCMP2592]|nr:unnamed protein product [Symbiodinium sp. CCMP2592]
MTCISGIAQQWEKIDEIRATYREHGKTFFSLDPTATARVPKITVKEAAHHAQVLKPQNFVFIRIRFVEWLKKLAELIFGAGNVPAKFADTPNKVAHRPLPPACEEGPIRYERLHVPGAANDVVASGPDAESAPNVASDPDVASAPNLASAPEVASAPDAVVLSDEEDENREYEFPGESSESGASVTDSVVADDDLDELEEDPFGFFDAAEAEANLSRDAVAAAEDDGHDQVPEKPSSSSSDKAPDQVVAPIQKNAVFIDVDDESETCAKCSLPKVLCKCLQIEQLKKQLNALKVQKRARKLAKQAKLARRAEDIFKSTFGEDGSSGSAGDDKEAVPFPLPEDETQVMAEAEMDVIADGMKSVPVDSDEEPEPPLVTRREQLAGKQARAEEARANDQKDGGKAKGKGRGGPIADDEKAIDKEANATAEPHEEEAIDQEANATAEPHEEEAIDKEANATAEPHDEEAIDNEDDATAEPHDEEAIDNEDDGTAGPNDEEAIDMEGGDKEADEAESEEAIDKEADDTSGVTSAGGSKPGKRKPAAPKSGPKAVAKKRAVLKKPAAKVARSAERDAEGEFYDTFPDELAVGLATQHSDEEPEGEPQDAVTAKPETKKKADRRKCGGAAKDAGAEVSKASKANAKKPLVEEPPKRRGRKAKVPEEPLVEEPPAKRGRKAKVPEEPLVEEPPAKRGRKAKVPEEPSVEEPPAKRGRKAKVPEERLVDEPAKKTGRKAKVPASVEERLVDEPAKKRGRKAQVARADDPDVRALVEDEYVLPTQTFARRRQPNPTLSSAKWLFIRKAFERIVLPKLDPGAKTAQEECLAGCVNL